MKQFGPSRLHLVFDLWVLVVWNLSRGPEAQEAGGGLGEDAAGPGGGSLELVSDQPLVRRVLRSTLCNARAFSVTHLRLCRFACVFFETGTGYRSVLNFIVPHPQEGYMSQRENIQQLVLLGVVMFRICCGGLTLGVPGLAGIAFRIWPEPPSPKPQTSQGCDIVSMQLFFVTHAV